MGLTTLRDENIVRILADPPLVWQVLAPDDPEIYADARDEAGGEGGAALALGEGEGDDVGLDKAWHAIHYLLTGTAWDGDPPLDLLVTGGTPVGDVDVGYGPARALTAAEVAEAHRALDGLSDEELRGRFDPAAMTDADIYPSIWDRAPEEDDVLGYVMGHLAELRAFLARAAGAGMGAVISLS